MKTLVLPIFLPKLQHNMCQKHNNNIKKKKHQKTKAEGAQETCLLKDYTG